MPIYKNQKRTLRNGLNPLAYEGVEPSSPSDMVTDVRDPISGTSQDYQGFNVGDEWENRATRDVFKLVSKDNSVATWVKMVGGAGNVTNLIDDAGNVVLPDATGGITVQGGELINTAQTGVSSLAVNLDRGLNGQVPIAATGAPTIYANLTEGANVNIVNGPNSITISAAGGGAGDLTMVGNDGSTATSVFGSINVLGAGGIVTSGDLADTFTIETDGTIATSYLTDDANSAIPAAGVLTVAGAHNNNTTSAGSTVTINGDNAVTFGDLADVSLTPAITIASGDIWLTDPNGSQDPTTCQMIKFRSNVGQVGNISMFLNNTFIGTRAGNLTMTPGVALFNIGIGSDSERNLTTGQGNIGIGNATNEQVTTGGNNIAIGYTALSKETTGFENVAVGDGALFNLVTGSQNICLGDGAGDNYLGAESSNIIIQARPTAIAGESHTMRIGYQTGAGVGEQNRCFISGIRGITTGINNAIAVRIDSAGQLGTVSSSLRFKENVKDMAQDSAAIYNLHPVTFNYKTDETKSKRYGLIAEEVAKVLPHLTATGADGQIEAVAYEDLSVLLLNELIKLREEVVALKKKVTALPK